MQTDQPDETTPDVFTYKKQLALLIAISSVVRIFLAASFELGNAEAYYWVLSNKLQWNYFDHPPMVAWLIRATTVNGLLHSELFVRLGAIIASGICTWLVYQLGAIAYNRRTGWLAAVLYTTSVYASIGIGVYILPDSPQMIFWLAGMMLFIKLVDDRFATGNKRLAWCLFGVVAGLCIMSKVHGVFIWAGMLAYLLIYRRYEFRNPFLYIAVIITLVIISPIIIWNLDNHFAAIKFHSSRVDIGNGHFDLIGFAKRLMEVFFSTGPIQFVLIVIAVYFVMARKLAPGTKPSRVLLLCNLPPVVIILVISMFRETLPHWPGPPLSALLVLPAAWLASREKAGRRKLPGVLEVAIIYVIVVAAGEVLAINYFPGTTSKVREGMRLGADDATLDQYGWKQATKAFDSVYNQDIKKGLIKKGAPILATNWIMASHLDYYIAHNTQQQVYGLGNIDSLHQYYWLNKYKTTPQIGDDAFYIIPSNQFQYRTFDEVANRFKSFTIDMMLSQYRSGEECKRLYVFRLISFKGLGHSE